MQITPPRPGVKLPEESVVVCNKCGNTWLELLAVQQFSDMDLITLGQKPVSKGETPFYIFRCPKCLQLQEPPVNSNPIDSARKSYDKCLDSLTTPAINKVTGEKI